MSADTKKAETLVFVEDFSLSGMSLELYMVAEDGIEPPTRGFSIPCSTN
jgi:hypothetical protein